jgi:hypothetical protein
MNTFHKILFFSCSLHTINRLLVRLNNVMYITSAAITRRCMMQDFHNFEQWKSFLRERLEQGKQDGLSEEVISNVAYEIGGYLSNEVNPDIPENIILSELWQVATEQEKHAIANLMVKLVQK